MRAAGLDFERRQLAEFDLPEPGELREGEVLLEVLEVGICATDRELAHFHFGAPPPGETRLALGHEALARVVSTGPGVSGLQPGDLVAPMIREACGLACRGCGAGRTDLCETGKYRERGIVAMHGYLAPRLAEPAARLLAVPPSLADRAVLMEPLSVVEKAVETAWHTAPFEPRTALVFGAGPIGLLTVLALLHRGVAVTCCSLEPADHPRARIAARAGANYERQTPRAMADLVFEASGSAAAARAAFEWLAPLGVLILVGAADFDLRFPGIRTVVENQAVVGVVNAGKPHFEAALRDLRRFDPAVTSRLVARRRFAEWREAILSQGSTDAIKTVLPLH